MATLDSATHEQLRPILYTEILPTASLFLASPKLAEDEAILLRDTLLAFSGTPEGQAFLAKSDYEGLVPISPDELTYLDRFLEPTRRALAEGP